MRKLARLRTRLTPAFGLSAALVLASCAQTGPASSTPPTASHSVSHPASTSTSAASRSTSTSAAAPSTSATRPIDITVTGKQVKPTPAMVNLAVGQSLTISITSDHDNTLHAHGFDIEEAVKAGRQLKITVKGAQPGVYDVELHDPELRLLQVAVR